MTIMNRHNFFLVLIKKNKLKLLTLNFPTYFKSSVKLNLKKRILSENICKNMKILQSGCSPSKMPAFNTFLKE